VSEDRKTRRRFLADMLFAGGALTAASVLGYVATHTAGETAAATPTPEVVGTGGPLETPGPGTPACTPAPIDIRPAGAVPAPPPREVMPSGRTANPRPVVPRDPMAPQRQDSQPEGGARPAPR